MFPSTSTIQSQIKILISSLSKKTSKHILSEVNQLLKMSGDDQSRSQVLIALLLEINIRDQQAATKDSEKIRAFTEELVNIMKRPNFTSIFCQLVEEYLARTIHNLSRPVVEDFSVCFYRTIKLSPLQLLLTYISLARSQHITINSEGRRLFRSKISIQELIHANFAEISEDSVYLLLNHVSSSEEFTPQDYFSIVSSLKTSLSLTTVYPQVLPRLLSAVAAATSGSGGGGGLGAGVGAGISSNMRRMWSYLIDCGSSCSSSIDLFQKTLSTSGIAMTEDQLAELLIVLSGRATGEIPRTDESDQAKWNLEVVADALQRYPDCADLNWARVVQYFDSPLLSFRHDTTFNFLFEMLRRISTKPLIAAGLCAGLWKNKAVQFELLVRFVNQPKGAVDFISHTATEKLGQEIPEPLNHSWSCVTLYNILLVLANHGLPMEVKNLLEMAANSFPEYVFICLCQAQAQDQSQDPNVPSKQIRLHILRMVMPLFLILKGTRPSSLVVMKRLAVVGADFLVYIFKSSLKGARSLVEINEIDTRLKMPIFFQVAAKVESESSFEELLSLYCHRSDIKDINLLEKIRPILEKNPGAVKGIVQFIRDHADNIKNFNIPDRGVLSLENLTTLLKELRNPPHNSIVTDPEFKELYTYVEQRMAAMHQQQQQQQQQQRPAPAEDVEEEAILYLQRIYNGDLSIPDCIILLNRFKTSNDRREQDIFRSIFEIYSMSTVSSRNIPIKN